MEMQEYRNIYEQESSHFLYTSRHNLVIHLLRKYLRNRKNLQVLDAGSGTGLLAKKLKAYGKVWAVDTSDEAIRFAKERGVEVKKATVEKLPFKEDFFDLVVSVDVIYHQKVKNDQEALNEFYRVLKLGGFLILRVPANKWLKLAHDKHVHTRERYGREELKGKLLRAGFKIEKLSFVHSLLLPFASLKAMQEGIMKSPTTRSAVTKLPASINNLLTKLLNLEIALLKKINIPFGIGLISVCKKPLSSGHKISPSKKTSKNKTQY